MNGFANANRGDIGDNKPLLWHCIRSGDVSEHWAESSFNMIPENKYGRTVLLSVI